MEIEHNLKALIFMLCLGLSACQQSSDDLPNKSVPSKEIPVTTLQEPSPIPKVILLSKLQADQIKVHVDLAIRILSRQQSFEATSATFGTISGTREPKGPGDKLVIFYSKLVDGQPFQTHFTRRENKREWSKIVISAQPASHPQAAYGMAFDGDFFKNLTFEKKSKKVFESQNRKQPEVNIFTYISNTEVVLRITFQSFASLSSIDNKFPISFYSVEIEIV